MRWPLALWRKLFSPEDPFDASRYADPAVARGAYLVQGPGHCGACHTPRGVFLEEQALDDSKDSYLAGVPVVDGWVAVSLRGDDADGLGAWSAEDIVRTLRSARNSAHAVIGGPMNDVVVHSTQYLTEEDLRAIAAYLKSLPEAARPPASFKADARTAAALAAGRESDRGAELYLDNCAACHRSNGEGAAGVLPAIAANSTVLAADPTSIIHLILRGSVLPATVSAPSRLGMPGFGWRLSDVEVAELATFIRASWGNHAPAVSASQVRNLREFLRGETLGTATANDPR
jgi:mono/diheme cytochrome c family protein